MSLVPVALVHLLTAESGSDLQPVLSGSEGSYLKQLQTIGCCVSGSFITANREKFGPDSCWTRKWWKNLKLICTYVKYKRRDCVSVKPLSLTFNYNAGCVPHRRLSMPNLGWLLITCQSPNLARLDFSAAVPRVAAGKHWRDAIFPVRYPVLIVHPWI